MEKTFLKRFFWFAFAAFLSASIPHVAYFFRAFEPGASGLWDIAYWVGSYAIALSIDITIFLLSLTVAKLHRQKAAKKLIASVWLFIVALALLSWFINWEYATTFASTMLAPVENIRLAYIGRIGDVNPLIASCFQILAIAYTWIADKIEANEKPKSAEELKKEADELEARLEQEKRIKGMKRELNQERPQNATGTAIAWINAGKTIAKTALSREQNDTKSELNQEQNESKLALTDNQNAPINTGINEAYQDDNQEQKDTLEASYEQVKADDNQELPASLPKAKNKTWLEIVTRLGGKCAHCGYNNIDGLTIDHVNGDGYAERAVMGKSYRYILDTLESGNYQVLCANCNTIKSKSEPQKARYTLTIEQMYPKLFQYMEEGRKTLTQSEIADCLHLTPRMVRNRINDATFKRSPRNENQFLIRTVCDFAKTLYAKTQSPPMVNGMGALKIVGSVSEQEIINDTLEQNTGKTDELEVIKLPLNQEQTA